MTEEKSLRIGIAAIIINGNTVLLGERINVHGHGTYNFPGGHLEKGETLKDCVLREVREETDLDIKLIDQSPCTSTNDVFEEGKHYRTQFFRVNYLGGEPRVMEPNKCKRWNWHTWYSLPKPLFLPIQNLLKQGYNPFNDLK